MKQHILIVEDEPKLIFSLSCILKDAGYNISLASDGMKALRIIQQNHDHIDLILLDIQMPRLNGIQLLDELKRQEINIPPTLIMTGFGNKEILVEIIRRGCAEYIDKPFTPDQLLSAINNAIKKCEFIERKHIEEITNMRKKHVQLNRVVEQYQNKYESLRGELDKAVHSFQNLVSIKPDEYNVNISCRIQQLINLGGDFIGLHNTDDGCNILVADVAGHDLAASYHAIMVKSLFEDNKRSCYDGINFLKILNGILYNNGHNDRMVTALFIHIDLKKMTLNAISAGHPYLIRIQKSSCLQPCLKKPSSPLGMSENVILEQVSFPISLNDKILLHTDGVSGVCRINGETGMREKMSGKKLAAFATEHIDESLEDMIGNTWDMAMEFCRHKQNDDMLLAGIEISKTLSKGDAESA